MFKIQTQVKIILGELIHIFSDKCQLLGDPSHLLSQRFLPK